MLSTSVVLAAPPVSAELGMDDPVPTAALDGPSVTSDVAWNGSTHLVVWDQNEAATGYDVFAVRLDASGAAIGSPFVIATGEGHQRRPRVASDGVGFLVVWDSQVGAVFTVRGARVDDGGTLLDPAGFDIATPGVQEPEVTYEDGTYFVAWASTAAGETRVARVDTSGNVVDPGGVALGSGTAPIRMGWNGSELLLAWTATTVDVVARRLSPSLVPLDAAPFVVSTSAATKSVGGVGSDGAGFLVAWTANLGYTVTAARVSAAGAVLDAVPIGVSQFGGKPSVVHDGANYLVVWGGTNAEARRVGSDGLLVDATPVLVSGAAGQQDSPMVTESAAGFLAVWGDTRVNKGRELWGARIGPGPSVLDPNGLEIKGNTIYIANKQGRSAVASSGSVYLAVWEDGRTPGKTGIYGTRLSDTGQILDPAGLLISQTGSYPAVTWDGTDFVVAWQGSGEIRLTRVTESGMVMTPGGVGVTVAGGDDAGDLAMSSDGTNVLVAYTRSNVFSTIPDVFAMLLTPSFQKIGIDLFVADPATHPGVVFDGTSYLVVFASGDFYSEQYIYARRLSPAGVWLDPGKIPVAIDVSGNLDPLVAFDGTRSLVVWARGDSTVSDIYGARITPAGQVLDLPFLIASAPGPQWRPVVGHDGTDFLVAWIDRRGGLQWDVYGARVTGSAQILDPGGFEISSLPEGVWDPAGIAVLPGTALVTYSRNDKAPGIANQRVHGRLVGDVASGGGGAGGSGAGGAMGSGGAGGDVTTTGVGGAGGMAGSSGAGGSAMGGSGMGGSGAGGSMGGSGTGGSTGGSGAGGSSVGGSGAGGSTGGSGAAGGSMGGAGGGGQPGGGGQCNCGVVGEAGSTPSAAWGASMLFAALVMAIRRRPRRRARAGHSA